MNLRRFPTFSPRVSPLFLICVAFALLCQPANAGDGPTVKMMVGSATVDPSDITENAIIQIPILIQNVGSNFFTIDITELSFAVDLTGDTQLITGGVTANVLVANAFALPAPPGTGIIGVRSPGVDLVNRFTSPSPTASLIFNSATNPADIHVPFLSIDFIAGMSNGVWQLDNNFMKVPGRKYGMVSEPDSGSVIGTLFGDINNNLVGVLEIPVAAHPAQGRIVITPTPNAPGSSWNFIKFNAPAPTIEFLDLTDGAGQLNLVDVPQWDDENTATVSDNLGSEVSTTIPDTINIDYLDPAVAGDGGSLLFTLTHAETVKRIRVTGSDGYSTVISGVTGTETLLEINSREDGSPSALDSSVDYAIVYETEFPASSGTFIAGPPCTLSVAWNPAACTIALDPTVATTAAEENVAVIVTLTNAMSEDLVSKPPLPRFGVLTQANGSTFVISGPPTDVQDNVLTYNPTTVLIAVTGSDAGEYTVELRGPGSLSNVGTCSAVLIVDSPTDIQITNSTVAENEPTGTLVGELSAVDPTSGDSHTFTLVTGDGDTDNTLFRIAGGNQLETNAVFDFETKNEYTLRVKVIDNGGGTFEKAFAITIDDANDAPTSLAIDSAFLTLTAPGGTVVGVLTTEDVDKDDTHAYTLVAGSGDEDNDLFDTSNDRLITRPLAAKGEQTSFSVRIETRDSGGATVESEFAITSVLWDQSDQGSDTDAYLAQDFEEAQDDSDSEVADDFVVQADTIWLIDSVTLFAVIDGTPPSTASVTFYNSASDAPGAAVVTFESLPLLHEGNNVFRVDLPEPARIGSGAHWVSVQPDLAFSAPGAIFLVRGRDVANGDVAKFRNPADGWNSGCADWGAASECDLNPLSEIPPPDPTAPDIMFRLEGGVTEEPTFSSSPLQSATEDVEYLYNITTADSGLGDSVVASTLPEWLSVDDNGDGTALLSGIPRNEDVGVHDVTLQVTFRSVVTDVQEFTITVINVNDAPEFDTEPISEATEDQLYTYFVSVSDPDIGDSTTLSADTFPDWLTFSASVKGGATLFGTPDNDDVGDHEVVFRATDELSEVTLQSFTITVENVNDDPTGISLSSTQVVANATAGRAVGVFSTDDVDVGDSHTYTLVAGAGDDHNGLFTMDGDWLRTGAILDMATHSSLNVRVRSEDTGGVSVEEIFTITVVEADVELCAAFDDISDDYLDFRIQFEIGENDIDADGVDELFTLALVERIACGVDFVSLAAATLNAYEINLFTVDEERQGGDIEQYREVIAVLMLISEATQDALVDILLDQGIALEGTYESVLCDGTEGCMPSSIPGLSLREAYRIFDENEKGLTEPYSGSGNLDGDAFSNRVEFENINADGASPSNFAEAATDPELNGTEFSDQGCGAGVRFGAHASGSVGDKSVVLFVALLLWLTGAIGRRAEGIHFSGRPQREPR